VKDPDFLCLAQGAPHLSYDEIVGHPRMAEARTLYVSRFLALYDRDPFMARLLIETGRFLVYLVALILGAVQDPARRETWLTISRLKKAVAVFGVGTDRHIDQIIGRLCEVGFLASHAAEQDRRIRILKPTETMLAHDRAWLAAHYAPLTVVSRFGDYEPVMREDPNYQHSNRKVSVDFVPFSGRLLAVSPEMLLFFKHAGGHMVSAALLQAAMATPDTHAAVRYAEIGDRFGISRTHVRTIVTEAQEAGLVRLDGRGGQRVQLLPAFLASYDRALAAGMLSHDMVHALATGRRAPALASADSSPMPVRAEIAATPTGPF